MRKEFEDSGAVAVPALLPDKVIDQYVNDWWNRRFSFDNAHHGSGTTQLYATNPEIRSVLLNDRIVEVLEELGICVALHSELTQWRSANTGWHVDIFHGNVDAPGTYVGIWVALDDIDPESGVFQYLPGSHRWPLSSDDHSRVNDLCHEAMTANPHEVVSFIPKKGDILVWNGRVIHRGSAPKADIPRPALIGHYANQWSWPGAPVPSFREVRDTMRVDPTTVRHGKGWYKVNLSNIDYDDVVNIYSESGMLVE